MAKGYWIARVDVHDAEAYKKYIAANAAPLAKFGARFLVRGGKTESMAGGRRARNVVIEFESYEKALACWHSPEYQRAARLREPPIAEGDFIICEGYDGEQPGGISGA
ncbi:MAG: DUF1330 domain-containing protein [Hyphomicrobiales bacterium]|nr:DUF1330 domain-containing protein [Hyphomicrobiales bacterium]MBV8428407.1 DUF1330 domain-containing protein [Hyphomicrobiales bacterium]MBV9738988.1 DUF1330 domain-containing protein [Hyphomicrobiales bacterium]